MITARKGKNGIEVRFSGTADDIQTEMTLVLVNGTMAISENDKEDAKDNFITTVLTAMDLLKDKDVDVDIENFKRVLDIKSKIDLGQVVDVIEMIMGAIKGEEPDGK